MECEWYLYRLIHPQYFAEFLQCELRQYCSPGFHSCEHVYGINTKHGSTVLCWFRGRTELQPSPFRRAKSWQLVPVSPVSPVALSTTGQEKTEEQQAGSAVIRHGLSCHSSASVRLGDGKEMEFVEEVAAIVDGSPTSMTAEDCMDELGLGALDALGARCAYFGK